MELVKIDSEVRNALAEYLSQNGFGPEVRLRTLGIGCMGAVIDLITDSKKVDDYEMPFENFTFVTMPPTAAQMMMKAIAPVPGSGNLLYPNSGNTSTLQSTL